MLLRCRQSADAYSRVTGSADQSYVGRRQYSARLDIVKRIPSCPGLTRASTNSWLGTVNKANCCCRWKSVGYDCYMREQIFNEKIGRASCRERVCQYV